MTTLPTVPHRAQLLLALLVVALTSACGRPIGDFTFQWQFGGDSSCAAARVSEVDIVVLDEFDRVHRARTVICAGAGLTVLDLPAGDYLVLLDAFSARGLLVFQGEAEVRVRGGTLTDIGVVRLDRVGAAANGDLTFTWRFDGERSCSRAGVHEVDVTVIEDATGDTLLLETADCVGEGLFLLDLPAVRVTVLLDAYDGRNNLRYTGDASVTVRGDSLLDIGLIDLDPVP